MRPPTDVIAALVVLSPAGLVLAPACGSLNLARTLGRGNWELSGSVGGPMLDVGSAVFPAPQVRVGSRHGVSDDLDVMAQVQLDSSTSGVLALNAGVVGQMTRSPGGFAMALSARLHAAIDLDDAVWPALFPEVGLHLEHPLEPRVWLFFGTSGLGQIDPPPDRPFLFLAPYLGIEVRFDPVGAELREQTGLALQVGWINPWETRTSLVRYVPDGAGALTVVLSVRHRIGGIER